MATYPIAGRSLELKGYTFGVPTFYSAFHNGADLAAEVGELVLALAPGVVERAVGGIVAGSAQDTDPNGNHVVLRDVEGRQHWLVHLQDVYVQASEPVAEGQPLGTVGWTGLLAPKSPEMAHLHYVLYAPTGALLDPRPFLQSGGTVAAAAAFPAGEPAFAAAPAPQERTNVLLLLGLGALAWILLRG